MKKYICILLAMLPFMVGCSKEEVGGDLSSNELYQTTWNGTMTSYGSTDTPSVVSQFVVEFISTTDGKCAVPDYHKTQNFHYSIVDSIITFQDTGILCGEWYIISYTDEQIILQSYRPHKMVITLNKINSFN